MRHFSVAIICLLFLSPAFAQSDILPQDITIERFPCRALEKQRAFVTNLITGRGVSEFVLDPKQDQVPPCGGQATRVDTALAFPLEQPFPQLVKVRSDGGQCSGALVSTSFVNGAIGVITAAHCVFGSHGVLKNVRVLPGYHRGKNPQFGEFVGTEVLAFTGYTADKQNAHDIAVIKFHGAILEPKFSAFGLSAYASGCDNIFKRYSRPHYNPTHANLELQSMAEGMIRSCVDGTIVAGSPTGGGSSGSPVVDSYSRSIFGVHSAGDGKFSYEAPLTRAKICAIFSFLEGVGYSDCPAT